MDLCTSIDCNRFRMITILRGLIRLVLFILVLTFFVLRLLITGLFKGLTLKLGLKHRRQCCRALIKVLGIKVETKGNIHSGNYLFISNHRCYLDPVAQLKDIVALPVAKAEVEKIPILGFGAKITGIHFVKRENMRSRKETRDNIAETILDGNAILIYPEGTTIKKPLSGAFKPGTFRMAARNKIQIVPVAIEYVHPDDPWVGPESMPIHFLRNFGKRHKKIKIHYGEPVWMEDGEKLRVEVRSWIDKELMAIRAQWGLPVAGGKAAIKTGN